MSVKIKLKHSSVLNKAPQPSDLDNGELALNTNAASPAAYIKDSAGSIVKLAGAGAVGGTPATETAAGIVELATAAETTTGTDNTRAVHPAGLKVELDKKVKKAGDTMTGDLVMNDGTNDVITLDASAGSITSTDGTKSVVVNKNGTVVASGDIQSTSQNGGQLAGFRNVLINGGFNIAQRGKSGSITDGTPVAGRYTADRWLAYVRSVGTTLSWTVDAVTTADIPNVPISSYLRLQTPAGQDGWNLEQRIELPSTNNVSPFDAGTSWTLSFWAFTTHPLSLSPSLQIMASGVSVGSSPVSSDQGSTAITQAAWAKYTFNFTNIAAFTSLPASSSYCRLKFGGPTDGVQTDFYISNVQLEPGPVATPFEYRQIGTELALCQRFYQTRSSGTVNAADLRPTMRVTPTIAGNTYDAEP